MDEMLERFATSRCDEQHGCEEYIAAHVQHVPPPSTKALNVTLAAIQSAMIK